MKREEQLKALRVATKAAQEGGRIALKYFKKLKDVSMKDGAGLVSEADRESEAAIMRIIRKSFPEHAFLGEEGGLNEVAGSPAGSKNPLWVVDPLDGTTNYVHGFPFFCVSIGLQVDGRIEVGVVWAPLMKYLFTATRGHGAFMNGKPMKVSRTEFIEDSLLSTGFSYKKSTILQTELRDFKRFAEQCRGIRRAGSAALDMCMVAWGVFDGFWERELAPWDTAAGSLLVSEAGGTVTTFDGRPFHFSEKTVLAGNRKIQPHLLKILKTPRR